MTFDAETRQQITDAVLTVAQTLSLRRWWDIDGPQDWEICVGDARATVAALRGDNLADYTEAGIGNELIGIDPTLDTTPLLRSLVTGSNGDGSISRLIAAGTAATIIDEATRRGEVAVLRDHDHIRLTSHGRSLLAQ